LVGQGSDSSEFTSELNDGVLHANGEDHDNPESDVAEDSTEDIQFVSKFTRVDLVEQLAEDKGVEDDGGLDSVVIFSPSRLLEGQSKLRNAGREVQEDKKDNDLEGGLSNDVSPHSRSDNSFEPSVWLSLEEFGGWSFSGKSQSSHGVHDQVNPKHLDGFQRRFSLGNSTNESDDDSNHVDSQLELDELSDGVVDVSSPHNSLDN